MTSYFRIHKGFLLEALMQQQSKSMKLTNPWMYAPSHSALSMQSYLSYSSNPPLNAYIQAGQLVTDEKDAGRGEKPCSDEGSSITDNRAAKSSDSSDENSEDSNSSTEGEYNNGPLTTDFKQPYVYADIYNQFGGTATQQPSDYSDFTAEMLKAYSNAMCYNSSSLYMNQLEQMAKAQANCKSSSVAVNTGILSTPSITSSSPTFTSSETAIPTSNAETSIDIEQQEKLPTIVLDVLNKKRKSKSICSLTSVKSISSTSDKEKSTVEKSTKKCRSSSITDPVVETSQPTVEDEKAASSLLNLLRGYNEFPEKLPNVETQFQIVQTAIKTEIG